MKKDWVSSSFGTAASLFLVLTAAKTVHVVSAFSVMLQRQQLVPIRRPVSRSSMPSMSLAATMAGDSSNNLKDLFDMEGWEAIVNDLDRIPIFTVATPEGDPLAYSYPINNVESPYSSSTAVPFFYCDVGDALRELEGAKTNTQIEGLDILPFPLGKAFQLWCQEEAVLVPSREAVVQAGAPPGTNPVGQEIPMFACLEIMEESEDGTGSAVLPLFLSLEDATAAVQEAVQYDTGGGGGGVQGAGGDLQVVCLSLRGAVEQLATIPETPAFHFIPPSSSMKYISEYLS